MTIDTGVSTRATYKKGSERIQRLRPQESSGTGSVHNTYSNDDMGTSSAHGFGTNPASIPRDNSEKTPPKLPRTISNQLVILIWVVVIVFGLSYGIEFLGGVDTINPNLLIIYTLISILLGFTIASNTKKIWYENDIIVHSENNDIGFVITGIGYSALAIIAYFNVDTFGPLVPLLLPIVMILMNLPSYSR